MDTLNAVSETALITLKSRVIETQKDNPVIVDEVGQKCLERLQRQLPIDTRQRILDRKLPASMTIYIALRARKYDAYARAFIKENSAGLVVSLGCGFDTRYWRVSGQPWPYVEVDLPEVIAAKREVLADLISYQTIGCSVLDERWIEEIRTIQPHTVLFLAEGLLMYLPKPDVVNLFNILSRTFSDSAIVFEAVHERYTKGRWKKRVEAKMKRQLGTDAGSSYQFGIRNAQEIETYGQNIKVLEEWSYFEDKDVKPSFLRLLRHFEFVTRTQWTIKAELK